MNLKQTIKRVLKEESEFSDGFKRRIDLFENFIWNNFVTNYPCDYYDFANFMRGIDNEIQSIIDEGVGPDGEPVSKWLNYDDAINYVERYMVDDLKEFYVRNCKE